MYVTIVPVIAFLREKKALYVPFDWIGSSSIDVPDKCWLVTRKERLYMLSFMKKVHDLQSKHQTPDKPKASKRK